MKFHFLLRSIPAGLGQGRKITEYCPADKFQWKIAAWQILQKSLKWQILAVVNKIKLKTCKIKNLLLYFAKDDTGINLLASCLYSK